MPANPHATHAAHEALTQMAAVQLRDQNFTPYEGLLAMSVLLQKLTAAHEASIELQGDLAALLAGIPE